MIRLALALCTLALPAAAVADRKARAPVQMTMLSQLTGEGRTRALHGVPGHGAPSTFDGARADTCDDLASPRERICKHIDAGGDIIGSVEVDQSAFARLDRFDTLAGRNARQVFTEMQWE